MARPVDARGGTLGRQPPSDAYLDEREPFDDINVALFQHGVKAVGIPTPDDWRDLLGRATRSGTTLGADLDEFPYDFAQYANYGDALKAIPARYPIPGPLSHAEFDEFLATNGPWKGVEVEDVEP